MKTLMHKNTPVAKFTFDKQSTTKVSKISEICDETLFPCAPTPIEFTRWFLIRKMPISRKDFDSIRNFYGSIKFESKTYRSLSDFYWVKDDKNESDLKWEDVDPRINWDCYEDEIFKSIIHPQNFYQNWTASSPNATLKSARPRFWYKVGDKFYIFNSDAQEDMNIYKKAKENSFESIVLPRNYTILSRKIYTTVLPESDEEDIELIPLSSLLCKVEDKNLSPAQNLVRCCDHFNIKNWRDFISKLSRLDELLGISDRDLSELNVLRNSKTGEYLSFARI